MYKNPANAIQRARLARGITQEKLAELSGYCTDTVRAWESGQRAATMESLDILAQILDSPWLPAVYLREQHTELVDVVPNFEPEAELAPATMRLINAIYAFADSHSDRKLMRIAEDNVISTEERPEFDEILPELSELVEAAMEVKFARKDEDHVSQTGKGR